MKKTAIVISPVLLIIILLALYFGAIGSVEMHSAMANEQPGSEVDGFGAGLSDEMDQIAKSFRSIQFIFLAITGTMMLYFFILFMSLFLIARKRRVNMRKAAPAARRTPKPVHDNTNSNVRADMQAAVKVEGTYIGNKRSGKIDVESFLAKGYDEPEPVAEEAVRQTEPPYEDLEYTEAAPVIESDLDYELDAETGNIFAEALIYATGADIAFLNSGGIRGVLSCGNIVEADITRAFPFNDTVTVLGLKKSQIKAVLEHSVGMLPEKGGRFLQASGIVVELDLSMPIGERVVSVTLAGGEALSDVSEYIVAVNEYIAAGGDGYDMLAVLPKMSEEQTVVQAVLEYITNVGDEGLCEYENIKILNAC